MNVPTHVVLPDSGAELLRRELVQGFVQAGCRVTRVRPDDLHDGHSPHALAHLADSGPFLLFSVNFQGLGPLRQTLELLERCNGRAAVWCVDNPWNLLSGVRDPRWKNLPLFVTDDSFAAPLREHGATLVHHLPLAASLELFAPDAARDKAFPPPEDLAPFVFVGRSAFPGKEEFFAGQTVPEDARQRAESMLPQGARPDLTWWERELGCAPASFWPGKKARQPALGAENANLAWRGLCLRAAARSGLDIRGDRGYPGLDVFGDAGWREALPEGARLRPPVDYYARLPGIYARAAYSLCLTSLQLPRGLNQRHFDVWAAGGVCISDATPGLDIFPEELTRPIRFGKPSDIGPTAERLEKSRSRPALVAEWQRHLREKHRYFHRALSVLDVLEAHAP